MTKEAEEEGEDPIEKLTLAGVMIGEENQTDADGNLTGSRTVIMDNLEKNQEYRLYVYYKDNRDGQAKTDEAIFGSDLPQPGTFETDAAKAKALASKFTKLTSGTLDPSDNEPQNGNGIRKIMGFNEVVVTKAQTDASGNVIPAVYDYYEDFTTRDGIVIKEMEGTLGTSGYYLIGKNGNGENIYPTGKKGESSGKQLTATAKTDFIQDKYTRMFFVVERCPSNLRWSNEENWKTVMVDQGVGSDPTDPDYAPKYPTEEKDTEGNLVNPEFRSWDTEATELTKRNFRYYGSDYTYEPLTETTNEKGDIEYVAKMSLTYYPGQVLVPGYYYRIRALMFQYDEHWENPTLVSLEDEKSENQYASSTTWIWQKYEYNANDLPVKVTNVIRDKNSISATVRAANQGFYLDHHYYVRLWKYDTSTNQWVIQEDTKYYGQIDKKSLMQTALQVIKATV